MTPDEMRAEGRRRLYDLPKTVKCDDDTLMVVYSWWQIAAELVSRLDEILAEQKRTNRLLLARLQPPASDLASEPEENETPTPGPTPDAQARRE